MKTTNPILKKMQNKQPAYGVWLGIPSPHSARLLARQPVDWLLVDAEHSPVDAERMTLMILAISEANGPQAVVRLAEANAENIKRALDAGAAGVIAPMINTGGQAAQVVAWAKFPPMGTRSFGSAYAGLAFGQSMPEYLKASNAQSFAGVQVESKEALDDLDGIFSTPNLDMVFVGPVDLSVSLGLDPLPENEHPRFLEAMDAIHAAAKKHNMPLGIYASSAQAARQRVEEGFTFVNIASDIGAMVGGIGAALKTVHE